VYFGIFDGHAGSGCAVTAANELHQVCCLKKSYLL
jgi:serine/threonine protein phosphatase PrpC